MNIASNHARPANAESYPASKISEMLKLPIGFIQKYCDFARTEWKYTSTFQNSTIYYDLDVIRLWRDGVMSYGGLPIQYALERWIKELDAAKAERRVWENCRVEWIEYGQQSATKYEQEGCKVIEMSDKFVKIIGAKAFRKAKTAKGFAVFHEGRRINFLAKEPSVR